MIGIPSRNGGVFWFFCLFFACLGELIVEAEYPYSGPKRVRGWMVCLLLGEYPSLCFVLFFPDIPSTTTVPPLTPGTTQKMSQAVHESFKTFEREQQKFHISNGKPEASSDNLSFMCRSCRY